MVKIIVGQNCLGKSVYLEKLLCTVNVERLNTNVAEVCLNSDLGYNQERVDSLDDVIECGTIYLGDNSISITDLDFRVSKAFEDIVTVVCREGDYLYLDEPEYGLNSWEVAKLMCLIARVAETFTDVQIVTHDETFFGILDKSVYTVQYVNNEYTLQMVEGDIYAAID